MRRRLLQYERAVPATNALFPSLCFSHGSGCPGESKSIFFVRCEIVDEHGFGGVVVQFPNFPFLQREEAKCNCLDR